MTIFTTLDEIREHAPCTSGWSKLLKSLDKTHADDEPLALEHILDSNGLDDALWALRVVKRHEKELRLFACQCARLVLPSFEEKYPEDDRPRKALEAAEAFALGEIDKGEIKKAADAASHAADAAYAASHAAYAAYAASHAVYAASHAAYAADAADAASHAASHAAYAASHSVRVEMEKLFRGMCA